MLRCVPSKHLLFVNHWLTGRPGETGPSVQPKTLPELPFSLSAIDTNWSTTMSLFLPAISPGLQYVPEQFMQSNRWSMISSSVHNMIAYSIHKSSWIITDPISHSDSCKASTRQLIMDCLLHSALVVAATLAAVALSSHLCYRAMKAV